MTPLKRPDIAVHKTRAKKMPLVTTLPRIFKVQSQKKFPQTFSFEFFPPKTPQGVEKLRNTREQLATLKPRYFSVTFGAGGSTQQGTFDTVMSIHKAGYEAAPHLSCIGSDKQTLRNLLTKYKEQRIQHIVALRGDIPSGMHGGGEFKYANQLVEFIRQESGNQFHIEVAAYPEFHPQAVTPQEDLDNFKRKVDAGADSAITQYFFNPYAYYRFVEECEKRSIDIPVVPGIMPITNYSRLARFSDNCGAEIPRWIRQRLADFGEDTESITAFGVDVITELCQGLLDAGAPGLHFYTLNNALATMAIWKNLGL